MTACDLLIFSDVPDVWSTPLNSSIQLQSWGASKGASCIRVDLFRQLSHSELAASVQAHQPRLVLVDVHWELAPAVWRDPAFQASIATLRHSAHGVPLVVCLPWGQPCPAAGCGWLGHVDLICLSGVACAGPLRTFLATGSLGQSNLYYTEADSSITAQGAPVQLGQHSATVELEPWACDMRCGACSQEPGCTRSSLPWRAAGAPTHRAGELASCVQRMAAQGGGHIVLLDQNIFFPGKLALLEQLHTAHPSVTWVLSANGVAMPSLAPGDLARAGVAGVQLFLPEMAAASLGRVAQVRAAMSDGFLELIAGFGGPQDTPAAIAGWGQWAREAYAAGVLDNYIAAPQSIPLSSAVGVSGVYRFPFPGRTSGAAQPYWETDELDSDTLAACCQADTETFRSMSPMLRQLPTMSRAVALRSEGVGLHDLHWRVPVDLAALAQTRRARYAARAKGVA